MSSTHPRRAARPWALVTLCACALALGLAACGDDSDAGSGSAAAASGDRPVRIALVGYANSNNWTQWAYHGMKKAAKEHNATVTLIDGKFDPKVQPGAMQNAIQSKKFDAFFLFPVDSASMIPIVKQAGDAGLPVAVGEVLGTPEQSGKLQNLHPGVVATVGAPTAPQAEQFVTNIKAACAAKKGEGNPCKVAVMPGDRAFPTDAIKIQHIRDELEKTPNITYELTPDGHFAKPDGYKGATNFLQNNKDIDVFHANGDQMIFGVVQALRENGLEPGKDVLVSGFGGTQEGVAGIRDGSWFATVALYPQVTGIKGVEVLTKAVRKEPFEDIIDPALLPGGFGIIDKQVLEEHPDFKGDWSADGQPTG